MAVLVTGAAGFIGSHVAVHLLRAGHEVIALDDLSGGFRDNVPDSSTFVEGSILDEKLLDRLFEEHHIEYLFHLAAYAAEGLSHFIRRFNYRNNLIGSINLINRAVNHDVKLFVFTSSIAVYGSGQLPMREDMIPQPEDPYGIAKLAVEQDLKAAHEMFGLDTVIFRPHNVYGERQNMADLYRNVLGIFLRQLREGKPLTIFGDGTQTRAFTYIDDVAPLMVDALTRREAWNQVFNVGSSSPVSVNELAHVLCTAYGVDAKIDYLEARNEVQHAWCDHSRLEEVFDKRETWTLEDGVRRMVQWAKQSPMPQPQTYSGVEVQKNMPLSWRAWVTE